MSQYRQSPFANIPPVVKNLIIINVIFFIATYILGSRIDLVTLFSAYYFDSPQFKLWQPITYMFMHGGLTHIFFNMFALFMFGPILEYNLGSKRFLQLYFICGIGAVALQMVVQAIQIHGLTGGFTIAHPELESSYLDFGANAQKLFNAYNTPVLGASGAVYGILVAFAMVYPNMEMMMFFIPVPIKAKYMIGFYILLEIYLGFQQYGGDNVAHFAHLGGALIAFIVMKMWGIRRSDNFY